MASKRKYLVMFVLALCILLIVFDTLSLYFARKGKTSRIAEEEKKKCAIPQPKFDKVKSEPLRCYNYPDWINIHGGKVKFLRKNISCYFQEILRNTDQSYKLSSVVTEVQHGASVSKQFMAFQCTELETNSRKHEEDHVYVVGNEQLVKARKKQLKEKNENWNVYILGFDSVSRVQFEAQAPKSFEFLKKTMGATVLQQYNIVGDGTPQAFIPILTGKTEEEMPLTRKRYKTAKFVNIYPFVWNNFAKNGYYTSFAETDPQTGTYQYRLKGFDEQPTDFYTRPFYQRAYEHRKGHCLGGKPQYQNLFNIGEAIFETYPDLPKFVLTFSGITHDHPVLDLVDDDLFGHLNKMWSNHHNNTIFIIMADHGPRYGSFRTAYEGKLRELLPFMSFSVPQLFKFLHPDWMEHLKANSRRLTTPFDIHATLLDILDGSGMSQRDEVKGRSLSLFRKIPLSRTCSQAGIPPFFCGCLEHLPVRLDSPEIVNGVKHVLANINKETELDRKLCVKLEVDQVINASKSEPQERMIKFKKTVDYDGFEPDYSKSEASVDFIMYEAKFSTKPGGNIYEGYFSINKQTGAIDADINQVSSVSAYGDNPHCIQDKDPSLRQWCVCYDKIG